MAQVSNISNKLYAPQFQTSKPEIPTSTSCSLFLGTKNRNNSSKYSWVFNKNPIFTVNKKSQFNVVASVAAAEKPSTVPEIVLQPIKEISGTVKLPGSKSLSNRILLLAALSEGTTVVDNLLSSDDIHYNCSGFKSDSSSN